MVQRTGEEKANLPIYMMLLIHGAVYVLR